MIPWWRGLVVPSPPATEETGAISHEITPRRGIGWKLLKYEKYDCLNGVPFLFFF
jgi:hypothetical protein